jgi:hypothetical protein
MGKKGKSLLHFFYTLPLERVVRFQSAIDFAADSSPFYAIVGAHHLDLSLPLKQSDHIRIHCGASTSTEVASMYSPVFCVFSYQLLGCNTNRNRSNSAAS